MGDLALQRRFYAEELMATGNLKTRALVEALAAIERERFLPAGPWLVRAEGDWGGPPRQTPDADPRHVYHNLAIGIDPTRQLFNGGPGAVTTAIDALRLEPDQRVLHVGAGLGYYTAIMATIVGPKGRVVAVEVDDVLATEAKRNLSVFPCVEVQHGNAAAGLRQPVDAIFLSAGVTHPREEWLDAVVTGGRLLLLLTATMPQMGPLGKGPMLLLTKINDETFDIRTITPLISGYSAVGLRDDGLNEQLGKALSRGPFAMPKRLRRDNHEPCAACWLHGATFCFTSV